MPSRVPSVNEAVAYLGVWCHAVEVQAIRIFAEGNGMPDGPMTRQTDSYLFAIALRNLLRAAALLRNAAPKSAWSSIDRALNEFERKVPHAVDLRDVLDHFDDYARGKGELQKTRGGASEPNEWYERANDTYRLSLGLAPGAPLLTLEVRSATEAATTLVRAIEDCV
jgi:hypothetical protein